MESSIFSMIQLPSEVQYNASCGAFMLAQNLNVANERSLAAFGNSGGMTFKGIIGVFRSKQPCSCLHHAYL
jgi:hypothetical protein